MHPPRPDYGTDPVPVCGDFYLAFFFMVSASGFECVCGIELSYPHKTLGLII